MKQLNKFISEELEKDLLQYKVNVWLRQHPDELSLWDNACQSWQTTRQIDDNAVQQFANGTDVRAFVDFMNDSINDTDVHADDISIIKKIITNL